jgi:hypothetical protein
MLTGGVDAALAKYRSSAVQCSFLSMGQAVMVCCGLTDNSKIINLNLAISEFRYSSLGFLPRVRAPLISPASKPRASKSRSRAAACL